MQAYGQIFSSFRWFLFAPFFIIVAITITEAINAALIAQCRIKIHGTGGSIHFAFICGAHKHLMLGRSCLLSINILRAELLGILLLSRYAIELYAIIFAPYYGALNTSYKHLSVG